MNELKQNHITGGSRPKRNLLPSTAVNITASKISSGQNLTVDSDEKQLSKKSSENKLKLANFSYEEAANPLSSTNLADGVSDLSPNGVNSSKVKSKVQLSPKSEARGANLQ